MTVNARDIDVQSLVVSTTSMTMVEGETASFGVSLAYMPSAPVTVSISKTSGDSGISANPETLTFTEDNWNISRNVTVTSSLDINLTDSSAVFAFSSPGITDTVVNVKCFDADTTALIVTPALLQVNEGGTGESLVRLAYRPDVTNRKHCQNRRRRTVSASAATLTFTPANWNILQKVTVSAPVDSGQ